tara:strand:- start:3068 stop:3817 length:750 start_codon:yes stop_codon:yes gene_type:complete
MSKACNHGRLCNHVIRNLALSILAEKYDLYVNEYSYFDDINNKLGIELFVGNNKYDKTVKIITENYMNYINNNIEKNANFNLFGFFQSEEITNILYSHLKNKMENIIDKNPYKERYNNNNDVFLHIRLTDQNRFHIKIDYYIHCLNLLKYDKIYIGSNNFNADLIKEMKTLYPNIIFFKEGPIESIQFGSTCKNIILSHGSFSAVIGYLGFFSNVYFLNKKPGWCPLDLFTNKGFIPIDVDYSSDPKDK